MKTYVFIVLRRHGRLLLVRRGEFHGLHDVEVAPEESAIEAARRGSNEIALVYEPRIAVEKIEAQFNFRGERIRAVFATVECFRAIPLHSHGASFDFDLSRTKPDEILQFFERCRSTPQTVHAA